MAVALGSAGGCTVARRASQSAVDPQLRATGTALTRRDEPNGFRLGSYFVSDPRVSREDADATGLLLSSDAPRPVAQHRLEFGLEARATERTWAIECVSQRRRPPSSDYAAVLDENRDEIAIECTLRAGTDEALEEWVFRTEAELSHNFAGRLTKVGSDRTLDVEVVVWVQRFGKIRRHLPDPVAQVRDDNEIVAAMVLAKPEQAWMTSTIEHEVAEVAVSTMLALRFLPLGLE
ncbi:MAG: hypothetical protein JKY37_07495 [Nannocystaceae bacterium]|nr:hypothetical protein [Nannocystaceae bacterium]